MFGNHTHMRWSAAYKLACIPAMTCLALAAALAVGGCPLSDTEEFRPSPPRNRVSLTVSMNPQAGGDVFVNGSKVRMGARLDLDIEQTVQFRAQANSGFQFNRWVENGRTLSANPWQGTIVGDTFLVAEFDRVSDDNSDQSGREEGTIDNSGGDAGNQAENSGTGCDLCNAANGCEYTCLNIDDEAISPKTLRAGGLVQVTLDYELTGSPGHVLYTGIALNSAYAGTFYHGVPGQSGRSGSGRVAFTAPSTPGTYSVYVTVAHVRSESEMAQAVAAGQADRKRIGSLMVRSP